METQLHLITAIIAPMLIGAVIVLALQTRKQSITLDTAFKAYEAKWRETLAEVAQTHNNSTQGLYDLQKAIHNIQQELAAVQALTHMRPTTTAPRSPFTVPPKVTQPHV
jgi:uncharacterized protein HemX